MIKMASQSNTVNSASNKFWGLWLPIPTVIAVINSLFWTWLILQTVGYTEQPLEKAAEEIIQRF